MKNIVINKLLKVILNSFVAGIIFAIVGAAYLYFNNILGGVILSVGFILVLLYAYDTYIVKFPYILENNPLYLIETIVSLIGNIVGAIIIASILYLTPFYDGLLAIKTVEANIVELNHFEVLLYALINGLLIYFGVNTYKKAEQPIARFLVLILCVVGCSAFLNLNVGFTAFFFSAANFNANLWSKFFTILLGNSLGLILIPLIRKLRSKIA